MGLEARCTARFKRRVSTGIAQLETSELRFRGDFRFQIPFAEMTSVEASGGKLRVETEGGIATFDLGAQAEAWALKIRYPKPVIEKLGVKPGLMVSVLGVSDPGFLRDAKARATELAIGNPKRDSDLIFLATTKVADLARLTKLKESIRSDGAIWVVWKKGEANLKEDHVRAAGRRAGLVDVKVVAFSPTHSALKLVIPQADR